MTATGDLTFLRDCLTTAIREIQAAEELTGIYDTENMEDLIDLLKEAVTVADNMMGVGVL